VELRVRGVQENEGKVIQTRGKEERERERDCTTAV